MSTSYHLTAFALASNTGFVPTHHRGNRFDRLSARRIAGLRSQNVHCQNVFADATLRVPAFLPRLFMRGFDRHA